MWNGEFSSFMHCTALNYTVGQNFKAKIVGIATLQSMKSMKILATVITTYTKHIATQNLVTNTKHNTKFKANTISRQ